jgi:hypothetical protein
MKRTALLSAAVLAVWLGASARAGAEPPGALDRGFSAGVSIQPTVRPEQLGLPVFPGATPLREQGERHAGASIGAWGGPFGMEVHALKLRSREPVETVARWYREAMASQGRLLDCSHGKQAEPPPSDDKSADRQALRCGDDQPGPGGALFKLGTRNNLRVIALEPLAEGTRISLVRVAFRGDADASGASR